MNILDLVNNNMGMITLMVGSFAVYLYIKQKRDRKRDSARLILQEIRYAEQQIRNFRTVNNYQLYIRLLPTNSWNENIHLFVKDLEEHELDMISSFYARAKYIDFLIEKRSQQLIEHAVEIPFVPPKPQDLATIGLIKQVSDSIEFIHNTPVVEKLRIAIEKKWYSLL